MKTVYVVFVNGSDTYFYNVNKVIYTILDISIYVDEFNVSTIDQSNVLGFTVYLD